MAINSSKLNKGAADKEKAAPKDAPKDAAKERVTKVDQEKAAVVTNISPEDKNVSINSDKVGIIALLGDPTDKDTAHRNVPQADGTTKREKHEMSRTIGYTIKNFSDEPVEYLEFGLTQDYKKSDRLNHGDDPVQKQLAPGEEANLTIYEAAVLASAPEYNGRFNGGDVKFSAAFSQIKSKDGLESASENKATVRFQVVDTEGVTLRDMPVTDVLDFTKSEGANGRPRYTNRTIKEGFEKFAPVAARERRSTRSRRSASSAPAPNRRSQGAALFFQSALANASKSKKG